MVTVDARAGKTGETRPGKNGQGLGAGRPAREDERPASGWPTVATAGVQQPGRQAGAMTQQAATAAREQRRPEQAVERGRRRPRPGRGLGRPSGM